MHAYSRHEYALCVRVFHAVVENCLLSILVQATLVITQNGFESNECLDIVPFRTHCCAISIHTNAIAMLQNSYLKIDILL